MPTNDAITYLPQGRVPAWPIPWTRDGPGLPEQGRPKTRHNLSASESESLSLGDRSVILFVGPKELRIA